MTHPLRPSAALSRGHHRRTGGAGSAVVAGLLLLFAMGGCASADVRMLATSGSPAYELRGRSLAALDEQAQWLCPKGHQVVQQWERLHSAGPEANVALQWAASAGAWLEGQGDAARLTVQCKG